jgi:type VI secretion system protein ImpC
MSTEQQKGAGLELGEGSLLDQILSETKLAPGDESYEVAKRGIGAFIAEMLAPNRSGERVDKSVVDQMISEIDKRISAQINEILHHPKVQALESAWRGLKYLIDKVDFRENIRVEVMNCSKEDLLQDFEDSPEVVKSGLYRTVYSNEYGTFGGKPFGLMVSNYDFGPGPQDMALLSKVASVAAMAHTPFIANAAPQMFGTDKFDDLPKLRDLQSIFEGPQYARWQAFRESEDARYVGLTLPRFLLRLPYGQNTVPTKAFNFEEDVVGKHDSYLWGNSASIAFATRVADSASRSTAGARTSSVRSPAVRSRTCPSTSTRRWARSRRRSRPRSSSRSAVSSSSRRGLHRPGLPQGLDNAASSRRTRPRSRSTSAERPRGASRRRTTGSARSCRTCS